MANLNTKYKKRYGLSFPEQVSDIYIDLCCAKKWMLPEYKCGSLMTPGDHMIKAAKALFTPQEWCITPWTEEHCHAWAEEDFSVWLGAGSTGKSNDAGFLAVLDWVTDPLETYIALASTSVPMLKLRSFESVTRAFRVLKKHPAFLIPGKEHPSSTAIINDNDGGDLDATVKASIRGVALADGDEAKAVARLAGAHLPYVTIILDEGAALPEAAAKARINARMGTKRFRFLSLANPISYQDEATRFCTPVDGWQSVSKETPKWRSKFGLVLHHNGYDSPAIAEPEKYPFLINQDQIDETLRDCNDNSEDPMMYRMVYGFPTPAGSEVSVLSDADIVARDMKAPAIWTSVMSTIPVAGLDPAFTSGGDGCILQRGLVGVFKPGIYGLMLEKPDPILIDASSPVPVTYQVVKQVGELLHQHRIPVSSLAIDDSGTQSVADVVAMELGGTPIRCNFGGKASELFVEKQGIPANKRFRNQVTEMWFLFAALGRHGQLRGMCDKVAQQFTTRRFRRDTVPLALESKDVYKTRVTGQRSPDEGDAAGLCAWAARAVAGLNPGILAPQNMGPQSFRELMSAGMKPGSQKISSGYDKNVDITRGLGYLKHKY